MSRWQEIGKVLSERGKEAQEWSFPRWRWWLFSAKAVVCLLLLREGEHPWLALSEHDDIDEVAYLWCYSTSSMEWGQGAEFGTLSVARGWRHWHVHHEESGYP